MSERQLFLLFHFLCKIRESPLAVRKEYTSISRLDNIKKECVCQMPILVFLITVLLKWSWINMSFLWYVYLPYTLWLHSTCRIIEYGISIHYQVKLSKLMITFVMTQIDSFIIINKNYYDIGKKSFENMKMNSQQLLCISMWYTVCLFQAKTFLVNIYLIRRVRQ